MQNQIFKVLCKFALKTLKTKPVLEQVFLITTSRFEADFNDERESIVAIREILNHPRGYARDFHACFLWVLMISFLVGGLGGLSPQILMKSGCLQHVV
ncbi:unnamed protein product [Lactuca saligna]|uniref:Uncharacterized protein n=1 Tax=Lactuca saligna TaxID=75948 RepID=A0AA35YVJ9_LACSI|nr:unnamed protein product [Lactuca saligna]